MKYTLNYMRDGQVQHLEFEGTVRELEKEIHRLEQPSDENRGRCPMVFKIEAEDGRVFHKVAIG